MYSVIIGVAQVIFIIRFRARGLKLNAAVPNFVQFDIQQRIIIVNLSSVIVLKNWNLDIIV